MAQTFEFIKKIIKNPENFLFSSRAYVVYLFIFIVSIFIGSYLTLKFHSAKNSSAVEVDWRLLGELDYTNGKAPSVLEGLDGKLVKIPGFMVPLEDNARSVTDFLLVPSPQACIHVPPPPPNQMVFVKMENKGVEAAFIPIWVYGTLHLKSKKHMYGESSFSLSGLSIQPYK